MAFVKDTAKIPIIFDQRALDNVGLGSDTPITISIRGVTLKSVLQIMLGELDLAYVVRDEVLSITTRDAAENELDTRLYPVADLALVGTSPMIMTRPASRFERLCDLIRTNVVPNSWDEVGGPGSIVSRDEWDCLVVSQTLEVHSSMEALLNTIRRARSVGRSSAPELNAGDERGPMRVMDEAERAARTHIEKALASEANLDFIDTPLQDIVNSLQDQFSIPILIDRKALDDVGLAGDTPVTMSLQGVSLRSALRIMLKNLELVYTLEDAVLKITTPEAAENRLARCVFQVADLTAPATGPGGTGDSFDSLMAVITTTIAPDSWEQVGGPGAMTAVAPWGLLVVSQTDDVQEQIGGLLAAARCARMNQAPSPQPPMPLPGLGMAMGGELAGMSSAGAAGLSGFPGSAMPGVPAMVLKPYQLMGAHTLDQLTRVIMGTIEPDSWRQQSNAAAVFPLGHTLLIRQTPQAHAKIEELFRSLQSLQQIGGFSGGCPGWAVAWAGWGVDSSDGPAS